MKSSPRAIDGTAIFLSSVILAFFDPARHLSRTALRLGQAVQEECSGKGKIGMVYLSAATASIPDPDIGLSASEQQALRRAMIDLVLDRGFAALSLEGLCEATGIDQARLTADFPDLEAAYIWVHKQDAEELKAVISGATSRHSRWRDGLRAAAYGAARWIEAHQPQMRFGMIEMLGAGELAQAEREAELNWMVDVIDAARFELPDPAQVDRSIAIGVMGAIYSKLGTQIAHRDAEELGAATYVAECMYLAVLPYFGREAAQEELARESSDLKSYRDGQI